MSSDYQRRVMRVLRYIHDNPAGDLSLDRLADVAAMSRFHWHRVFHAMTGETCAQAVRRLRLYRAARWLMHKDWPITEVAAQAGYPNVNSFSRAFREGFGVSPSVFRKQGCVSNAQLDVTKGGFRLFDVDINETPQRRLAALSHKGPYTSLGETFQNLSETAWAHNLGPHIRGVVGIYYDDPNIVADADLRSHAGLVLTEDAPMPEDLEEVFIEAGPYAVLTYKGPYDGIKVGYDHLFGSWLPKSGREPADAPCYELYLNSPMDTARDDLLTEIYLPLTR